MSWATCLSAEPGAERERRRVAGPAARCTRRPGLCLARGDAQQLLNECKRKPHQMEGG